MKKRTSYDVIVIGGGHAGTEACSAAARMGAKTLLITHDITKIGEMSCNPSIGGLGKGHLVREIDALDGVMGRAIDYAGIQFRMLNSSKGSAVRGPRSQADRYLYKKFIQKTLNNQRNLEILQESVDGLIINDEKIHGVSLSSGERLLSKSVVLTTGTFLRGMIKIGNESIPAGRIGDKPSVKLAKTIESLKFSIGRLKTGTPARIDKKSINFNNLEEQLPDKTPTPFSFINSVIHREQISCYITHTNKKTHKIINDNLKLSPMYSGKINAMGARYCPSIEDKVVKFYNKNSHQVFLEPEGLKSEVVYPNGISTSLPENIQKEFISSINGLENAKILKPGYAIEYDYINPQQLTHNLQTKKIGNLFLAGQINGTTGYEEAAAQGLIAGINAAINNCKNHKNFILNRSDAYIGVLIDDLVTKGTSEPYRMFTSRSEYRLTLRADNADQRLTPLGVQIGCVSTNRNKIFLKKLQSLKKDFNNVRELSITPTKLKEKGIKIKLDGKRRTAYNLLSYKDYNFETIVKIWPELNHVSLDNRHLIETESKYESYLLRQKEDIKDYQKDENLILPKNINYSTIASLSNEVVEKLNKVRPPTLSAASRISGITPAALITLLRYVKKSKNYKVVV
ncbi:MAG: tRNA uridine 5-carboxymethylaminomethyl modification enzyme MnmG [Alphaproteobacteria bacterium MarineAlpha5_Bin9]|nr:MAG: tRNA uridine 5-carboxymethylaminomethyl modification enzyme MnmG [Alphaproteobacteria bacterium MarineAlpha5_Bin9]